MKSRPILFSAPMVRALLDGSKTQTRRIAKAPVLDDGTDFRDDDGWPLTYDEGSDSDLRAGCPYGQPGDRLWVRETYFAWGRWETRYSAKKGRDEWHFVDMTLECGKAYLYAADTPRPQPLGGKRDGGVTPNWWKRPAIFMPRAASRITPEVVGVRVERLQNISLRDVRAEGCEVREFWLFGADAAERQRIAANVYRALWMDINGAGSWSANPWVWVVEFRRIRP